MAGTSSFFGNVTSSCALTLGLSGAVGISTSGMTLGSKEVGGLAASATILSTASTFQLQVDPVSTFAVAPTGGQPDAITVNYTTTGATTIAARLAGTPLNIGLGLTNVSVDIEGVKSSSIFPSGIYRADVVMRCVSQ